MTVEVLLCAFHPVTGWRVRGVSRSESARPACVKIGSLWLLRIPAIRAIRPGSFCNPAKVAIEYVRSQNV